MGVVDEAVVVLPVVRDWWRLRGSGGTPVLRIILALHALSIDLIRLLILRRLRITPLDLPGGLEEVLCAEERRRFLRLLAPLAG